MKYETNLLTPPDLLPHRLSGVDAAIAPLARPPFKSINSGIPNNFYITFISTTYLSNI